MVRAVNRSAHVVRAVRWALTGKRRALAVLSACALLAVAVPAFAQSWWPFGGEQQQERGPPVPREPVYRDPPPGVPAPGWAPRWPAASGQGWSGGGGTRSPICLELEQRLVQEGQRGNESRSMLPMVENEIRRVEQENRPAQQQLDRDCYEYFLFSKTLRRTRKCVDLSTQVEEGRRRIADLEAQQRQLSSGPLLPGRHRPRAGAQQLRPCLSAAGPPPRRQRYLNLERRGKQRRRHGRFVRLAALRHLSHRLCPPVRRLLFPHQLLDAAEPLPARRRGLPVEVRRARRALSIIRTPAAASSRCRPRAPTSPIPSLKTRLPLPQGVCAGLLVQDHRVCSRSRCSAAARRCHTGSRRIRHPPRRVSWQPALRLRPRPRLSAPKASRSRCRGSSADPFHTLNLRWVEISRAGLRDAHARARVQSEAAAT